MFSDQLLLALRCVFFFFSSRRRHTRLVSDWSSDVCSSDLSVNLVSRLTSPPSGFIDHRLAVPPWSDRNNTRPPDRSEERRVGKSVDLGGRRIIKKKRDNTKIKT